MKHSALNLHVPQPTWRVGARGLEKDLSLESSLTLQNNTARNPERWPDLFCAWTVPAAVTVTQGVSQDIPKDYPIVRLIVFRETAAKPR